MMDHIPQRPPAMIVDELLRCEGNQIFCRTDWTVHPFFHDAHGNLVPVAMIEMLAQAAAALRGVQQLGQQQRPGLGMLTALKEFVIHAVPQGTVPLDIHVVLENSLGGHQITYGRITQNSRLLAEGRLFLFVGQ